MFIILRADLRTHKIHLKYSQNNIHFHSAVMFHRQIFPITMQILGESHILTVYGQSSQTLAIDSGYFLYMAIQDLY